MYFDAGRFQEAAEWYEAALKIHPKDVNASTDLGIAYYYMNQPDQALAQFDTSLDDRSRARQDAAQHRHRPRLRQAGPEGRGRGLAEGARRSRRPPKKRAPRGRRSTGCRSAHPDLGIRAQGTGHRSPGRSWPAGSSGSSCCLHRCARVVAAACAASPKACSAPRADAAAGGRRSCAIRSAAPSSCRPARSPSAPAPTCSSSARRSAAAPTQVKPAR